MAIAAPLGTETASPELMTVSELAEYLRLNERTVLKLAANGELPGVRLGNQWRFRRSVVDVWLDDQMLGVRRQPSTGTIGRPPTFEVSDGFKLEHIIPELSSVSMTQCLEELCAKAAALELVRDRTWFLGSLIERENVLSSGVGKGVAFPHTLDRHPDQIRRPFVLLGRSQEGIDFGASDGQPVRLVVLLGLRYQELHLPWLRRLSNLLQTGEVAPWLMTARNAKEIHQLLLASLAVGSSDG